MMSVFDWYLELRAFGRDVVSALRIARKLVVVPFRKETWNGLHNNTKRHVLSRAVA